eukprot:8006467-Ditylum_brightwellii.AAC.2
MTSSLICRVRGPPSSGTLQPTSDAEGKAEGEGSDESNYPSSGPPPRAPDVSDGVDGAMQPSPTDWVPSLSARASVSFTHGSDAGGQGTPL